MCHDIFSLNHNLKTISIAEENVMDDILAKFLSSSTFHVNVVRIWALQKNPKLLFLKKDLTTYLLLRLMVFQDETFIFSVERFLWKDSEILDLRPSNNDLNSPFSEI